MTDKDRIEKLEKMIGKLADLVVALMEVIPYGDSPAAAGYPEGLVQSARDLLTKKE